MLSLLRTFLPLRWFAFNPRRHSRRPWVHSSLVQKGGGACCFASVFLVRWCTIYGIVPRLSPSLREGGVVVVIVAIVRRRRRRSLPRACRV